MFRTQESIYYGASLWIYFTAYYFLNKNSIIDVRLGYIYVSRNIEIFKMKLRWIKSLWLLQCVAFLVSTETSHWEPISEADPGLLQHPRWSAVNYYHKSLCLGCCSSPRSASDYWTNSFTLLISLHFRQSLFQCGSFFFYQSSRRTLREK